MRKPLYLASFLVVLAFGVLNGQEFNYSDSWDKPGINLKYSGVDAVKLNFSMKGFRLEDFDLKGEAMKNIIFDEFFVPADEGMPNLPTASRMIAIPKGSVPRITITAMRDESIRDINIAPAPRLPLDNDPNPLVYEKDMRYYSKNAFFPAEPVMISEVSQLRGVDYVHVAFCPFRYNPVTKELRIIRDIKVEINFEGGTGHFGDDRLRSRWFDPILEDAFLNSESLPKMDYDARVRNLASSPTEETGAEYLIITPTSAPFLQWADSIRRWRVREGISTLVKTVTDVGGNTTTAIENYINNAYNTWTVPPAAVLLLGDYGTDGTINIISPIYNNYCASDNIYADVNGDHLPDIILARITANNATQLETMVSKGIKYERNPPTSAYFYSHPITALGWQTERWFQICSESVGGYFANVHGKTPVRINEIYSGTPGTVWSTATNTSTVVDYFGPNGQGYIPQYPNQLGGWTGGNATMINNAINTGSFLLQHRDHGMETGWGEPSYTNTNIDGLTNTDLTFIFSINCLTGKYNWSSECFTEKFHRYRYNNINSGALGVIGATEVSYSFVNDTYVWGMYDNMWPDFMPTYGTTPASRGLLPAFGNAAGKIYLSTSSWPYNTSNKEVTYHLFHHHGDAFLRLFSEVPQNLTVLHDPVLVAGSTTFTVTANAGSFICLTVNDQIIGTANGTGAPVQITIPAQVPPDQMRVTVTKQNYRRYSALVNIVPASGPYIVYNNATISDPAPNGNNNGMMDYAETNLLNVTLKNVGSQQATNVIATLSTTDPFITITDNTENFGVVDPNSTVTVPNAFTYSVANNIPDGRVVIFQLNIVSGANNWSSSFSITAHAPAFTIGNLTVQDNGPACNNDGILDPGETANLLIQVTNSGTSAVSNVIGVLSVVGGSSPYLTINNNSSVINPLNAGASGNAVFSVTANPTTPLGTPVNLNFNVSGGASGQYSASSTKQVVIGLIPTFVMSNTTVNTCTGNFYDSGGETGTYQNNENYTMTFNPGTSGNKVKAQFLSFETESGYDYLYIYDGPSTASPQVSGSPFHGTTSPGTIIASNTNTSGALTFRFTSDGSITKQGWKAAISCESTGPVPTINFTASQTIICENNSVNFTDNSTNNPTSWSWSFPGGTPSSSTQQNPSVTYTTTGTYDVSLTASNQYGSGSLTKTSYITVNPVPGVPGTPTGNSQLCQGSSPTSYTTTGTPAALNYVWSLEPASAGTISGNGIVATITWNSSFIGTASLKVKGTNNCGEGPWSAPLNINVDIAPLQPNQPSGPDYICQDSPNTEYLTDPVVGATSYEWAVEPANAGNITGVWTMGVVDWDPAFSGAAQIKVKAINSCGVSNWSVARAVTVEALPTAFNTTGGGNLCPGGTGLPVTLNGSQLNVNYTLYLDGVSTGTTLPGTGNVLTFNNLTQPGTYTIMGVSLNGCQNSMNGSAQIVLLELAGQAGTPTGPSYIYIPLTPVSEYLTSGASNATSYEWNLEPSNAGTIAGNGTVASVSWNTLFMGQALLKVRGLNECGPGPYSEALNITLDNNVGVSGATSQTLRIYPNPVSKVLTVTLPDTKGQAIVCLLNAPGEKVWEALHDFSDSGSFTIDVSGIASGTYLIKIETETQTWQQKVVILH
ncbi:MAG: PKD domain-containing protein [Bacteroidales bacterium]|nr:PKD domain-containing protein [Bacteroidales bacterium]NPV36019.1 PKD domain-containing protein [Bacteroidales bacterium]